MRIIILLSAAFALAACGFQTPAPEAAKKPRAEIIGNHPTAHLIRQKTITGDGVKVRLGAENFSEHTASFTPSGKIQSRLLRLEMQVEIFNQADEPLLKETLRAGEHIYRLGRAHADKLHIEATKRKLRREIMEATLRQIVRFNENLNDENFKNEKSKIK